MKSTAVVSLDVLGQKSVSVLQRSSCSCAVMGIDQMWVWELAWARLRSALWRSSDPREAVLSSWGHQSSPSGTAPCQFGLALRVLSQRQAPGHNFLSQAQGCCPFSWRCCPSPPHSVFLKKLIHPFNSKAHFPAKICMQEVSDDYSTLQDRQQNTTTVHRRFPTCCCPGKQP